MSPLIPVPREALAQLLKSSGSPLTPEEFAATQPEMSVLKKYPSRARAAAWSRNILLVTAIFAGLLVPFSLTVENIVIFVGLAVVAYFEARVYRGFQAGDPDAPFLGFSNQSCFAAAIMVYCTFHAVIPPQYSDLRDLADPGLISVAQTVSRIFFVIIGVAGGVSQFGLAWYYRSAKTTLPTTGAAA